VRAAHRMALDDAGFARHRRHGDRPQPTQYAGRRVLDEHGLGLGSVADVVYDADGVAPEYLVVDPGPLRAAHYVPVARSYSTADDQVVLTLDVYDPQARTVLAERTLRRSAFAAPRRYQDHSLRFTSRAGQTLEFRTYWHDTSYAKQDHVRVAVGRSSAQPASSSSSGSRTASAPTPPASSSGATQYALREVFVGPTDTYKLVGMLGTRQGLFTTLERPILFPRAAAARIRACNEALIACQGEAGLGASARAAT